MAVGDLVSDVVLRVASLEMRRGSRRILHDLSFDVSRGELLAIMGPSGSGKTTILRALAGLERFDEGCVSIDGVTLVPQNGGGTVHTRLARKVGMVFQFHCLFEHLSALENVCLAPVHAHGVARAEAVGRARALLATLGVEQRANALPRELSGGEAQRVAIARALAVDPPVLLMDEPTASLDPARRNELGQLLAQLVAQGRTLIVATHDEEFASAFASRIVRLTDGVLA